MSKLHKCITDEYEDCRKSIHKKSVWIKKNHQENNFNEGAIIVPRYESGWNLFFLKNRKNSQ